MPQFHTPTPFDRKPVGLLKQAISSDSETGQAAISHRLFVSAPGWQVPRPYTVHLHPDDKGTFLVSCPEFPEVVTFGEDEALRMARYAVLEALAARRGSDPPPLKWSAL